MAHAPDALVFSSNQRIHIFNPALADKMTWSSDLAEVHILSLPVTGGGWSLLQMVAAPRLKK